MKGIKTVNLFGIKYFMREGFPHYGDILRKVERVIDSCETLDQIATAWKFADLFESHCKRANINDQTRIIMRSVINNRLEDRWETLRLKKLNERR